MALRQQCLGHSTATNHNGGIMTALLTRVHDGICHVCDHAVESITGENVNEDIDVYPENVDDLFSGGI